MNDPLLAFLLMVGGLTCIAAWGACRVLTENRALRLRREADAIKNHVARGGGVPMGFPRALAEGYLQLRWFDILCYVLLGAGILGVTMGSIVIIRTVPAV